MMDDDAQRTASMFAMLRKDADDIGDLSPRDQAALDLARLGRIKLRNRAMKRGHSLATASCMADFFENLLEEQMTGRMATPLPGIK